MRPTLALYENPLLGSGEIANLSQQMRQWRHTLRDWGGFWDGYGIYWQPDENGIDPFTTEQQAWHMFHSGLGRRIVARLGSQIIYEGEIVKLTMTRGGITRIRDLGLLANSVQVLYTSPSINVLTNPGAEIGTTSGGTPGKTTWTGGNSFRHVYGDGSGHPDHPFPDVQFKTDWKFKGAKSYWCDTSPCTFEGFDYGGGIKLTSTTNAKSMTRYTLSFFIHITDNVAGKEIRWAVNDGVQELASGKITSQAAGGGNNCDLRFVTDFLSPDSVGALNVLIYGYYNANAKFYVDDVRLFETPTQLCTDIYTDSDSVGRYGTHHVQFTLGSLTSEEAIRQAQLSLAEYKWPRTEFPEDVSGGDQDGLTLETMGYISQTIWTMVEESLQGEASALISDLVGLCSLLSVGIVESNTKSAFIDAMDNVRVFDALEKIVKSGGAGGVRYSGGVWADRKFHYYLSDTTPRYVRKNGVWRHIGGTPVDPCRMRPGLARDDDMPEEPYQGRNPRWMYLEEIEYDRDSDTVRLRRASDLRNRLGAKPVNVDGAMAATVIGGRSFIR